MDHAGGVFEFGRCYIHPADIPMLDGRTLPARVGYVRGQLPPGEAPEASAFVPDGPVEFVPLKAGDKLDLGGRVLEVLHVPGHTRGSLCYLDTASGDFFAGDACNNNLRHHRGVPGGTAGPQGAPGGYPAVLPVPRAQPPGQELHRR